MSLPDRSPAVPRRVLAALALLACACGGGGSPAGPTPMASPSPAAPAQKPNIVFLLSDDMERDITRVMPKMRAALAAQGTTFSNAFVSTPLCSPSRATIMTGLYGHNSNVLWNGFPYGGWEVYQFNGHEGRDVGAQLQAAGYRTALFGKYQNNYPAGNDTFLPAGWNEWYAALSDRPADEFNYSLNENGRVVAYGSGSDQYMTDVLSRKMADFVRRADANDAQPFFMFAGLNHPHLPATPAPRYASAFAGEGAPRPPNWDEVDLSDKPRYMLDLPRIGPSDAATIDTLYRRRLQSLQAVDDLIDELVRTLQSSGELDNTFIIYFGDNGYMMGQHRFPQSKDAPYEESIGVPFVVRGPGVPANRTLAHLVGNVDFLPTFLQWAGVPVPGNLDGRSLVPLLGASPPSPEGFRTAFLIEGFRHGQPVRIPAYAGLRTLTHTYVEYETGEVEYYDLRSDPYQMESQHRILDSSTQTQLSARLARLRSCAGAACRD